MHLIAADGSSTRVIKDAQFARFRFSHDGSRLVTIGHGEKQRWELSTWDVATGTKLQTVILPLAAAADIEGLTLSRDEHRIIVGAGTPTSDIWLLEHFDRRAPTLWRRLFSR